MEAPLPSPVTLPLCFWSEEDERKPTDTHKFHSMSLSLRHNRWTACWWNRRYSLADLRSCSLVTNAVTLAGGSAVGLCISLHLKQTCTPTDDGSMCALKICFLLAYLWCTTGNRAHKKRWVFGVCSGAQWSNKLLRNYTSQCLHPIAQICLAKAQRSFSNRWNLTLCLCKCRKRSSAATIRETFYTTHISSKQLKYT